MSSELSAPEVSRAYGVSQLWISRLVARYRADGEAAYEPRPAFIKHDCDLIIELREKLCSKGLDNGPTPSPGTCNIIIS